MSQYPPQGPPQGYPPQQPQQPPQGYPPQQQPPQGYPPQGPPQGYPPQQPPYGQQPYGQQGPNPYQQGPSGPRASFGQRLGAYLLDALIIAVPAIILFFIFGGAAASQIEVDPVTGELTEGGGFFAGGLILMYLIILVGVLCYYGFLEGGRTGQTLGKKALNIRVIRQDTGGQLGFGKAALRWAVRALPSIIPFLGFVWTLLDHLWMLWDPEKQCLHDKVASTLVVPTAAYPIT